MLMVKPKYIMTGKFISEAFCKCWLNKEQKKYITSYTIWEVKIQASKFTSVISKYQGFFQDILILMYL